MSTPNSRKRKRIIHRQETYLRWFKEVSQLHNFSFRARKKFTPAQKASITKQYRKHRETLSKLSNDKGIFKKAKPTQLRNLKRGDIHKEGFIVTNKGIYVPGVRADKVKAGRQRVTIKGKGKDIRIAVSLPSRREEYFPYDESKDGMFNEFVSRLIKKYKPDDLYIQNENGRSIDRYTPKTFMRYINRDILPRIQTFKKKYGIDRTPFVGVWLIWNK